MVHRSRGRPPHPGPLTPAEQRVLRELRRGGTNAEIAERLGLSSETVKTHVARMLAKLELRTRRELAAWEPQGAGRWGRVRALVASPAALASLGQSTTGLAVAAGVVGAVVVAAGIIAAWPFLTKAPRTVHAPSGEAAVVATPAPGPLHTPTPTPTPTTGPVPTATAAPARATATPVPPAAPPPATTPPPAPTPAATAAPAGSTPVEDRRQRRTIDERYLRSVCLALRDFREGFYAAEVRAEEGDGGGAYLEPFVGLLESLRVVTPPDDMAAYHSAVLDHNGEVIDLIRVWEGPLVTALETWWRRPLGALYGGFGWMPGATQSFPSVPGAALARLSHLVEGISECTGPDHATYLGAGPRTSSEASARELWLVEKAAAYYDLHGREATIEHYNGPAALDGRWYVFLLDAETAAIVAHPYPELLGELPWETDTSGFQFRAALPLVEAGGARVLYTLQSGEDATGWARRHEDLIVGAGRADCVPRRGLGSDEPHDLRFIPRLESCALPRYASSTQTYDSHDPAGEVTAPGSYAFLLDVDDRGDVALTHDDLRRAVSLLVHPRDAEERALYDRVEAGDVVEWVPAEREECWNRYRVTEVLADLPGSLPRRHFAVEWLPVFWLWCSGPIAEDELEVELRWSPPAARPGSDGIPELLRDQPVEGAGTYRAVAYVFDLPPGLRLVRDTDGELSGSGSVLVLRDADSGSVLLLGDVEPSRTLTLEGLWRNVDAHFDAILESLR